MRLSREGVISGLPWRAFRVAYHPLHRYCHIPPERALYLFTPGRNGEYVMKKEFHLWKIGNTEVQRLIQCSILLSPRVKSER